MAPDITLLLHEQQPTGIMGLSYNDNAECDATLVVASGNCKALLAAAGMRMRVPCV